jgi:arylsulfatase A
MKRLLFPLFLMGVILKTSAQSPGSRPPNVILVVADDLSRNLCTWLPEGEGQSLMPTLDRLAAEGTVLNNMHSPSPVCTPSRFAILTGKYPSRARSSDLLRDIQKDSQAAVGFNTHIIPGEQTLQQRLQELGYVTGAFGKNHVIEVSGFKRVPYQADPLDPAVQARLHKNADLLKNAFIASGFTEADRLYHGNPDADGVKSLAVHNQDWITEGVLDFIERNQKKPFFIYMATTIPHGPFEPERSWRGDPRIIPTGYLSETEIPKVQVPRDTIDQRLKAAGISTWNAGQVLWLDDAMTAIMNKIADLQLDGDTVVIFVSDHGTEAKGGVYEGGTRTAALVWGPEKYSGKGVVEAGIQLTDLAPTVLEWAGSRRSPDHMDGRSFAGLLRGETPRIHDSLYFEMGYSRALIHDGFKYLAVRYPDRVNRKSVEERTRILNESNAALAARGRPLPTEDPMAPFSHLFLIPGGHDVDQGAVKGFPAFFERDQLYDLKNDPEEQNNLADDPAYARRLAEMKARMSLKLADLPGGFGELHTAAQGE